MAFRCCWLVSRVPGGCCWGRPPPGPHGALFLRPHTLYCVRACAVGGPFGFLRGGRWAAAVPFCALRVPCCAGAPSPARVPSGAARPQPLRGSGPPPSGRGPFRPLPSPGPGRCPRLFRSALVCRCRGSAGSLWPRLPLAPAFLCCGLPVRSALLRAALGRVQRVASPGPPLAVRSGFGPPAAFASLGPGGFGPGLLRPGGLSRPAAGSWCLRPPGCGLRPLSSGGGSSGGGCSWAAAAVAGGFPLPPPRPCRPLRGLAGSAWLRLGGSRPRPSGPPRCAAAASVLSKILDYWGLTFRLRRGMLFLRGSFRSHLGAALSPWGIHGRQKKLSRKTGLFFCPFFICCAVAVAAKSRV